eukprot:6978121-Pyramimonas_sp.AAC.1
MTSASRLSPKRPEVHSSMQCLIKNFFRIEIVVSVRMAKSIHELPPVTYADSCTLVRSDNDVNPVFDYYDAEGTALNIHDIFGSAHSSTIQCLKSTKPQAGFDQDMTNFEELADVPMQGNDASEAPEVDPPQEDG